LGFSEVPFSWRHKTDIKIGWRGLVLLEFDMQMQYVMGWSGIFELETLAKI
jgi:hypothetical protein